MSDNNQGIFGTVCFLAGAAVGAGLALLYAPQSGVETRQQIKDASEKVSGDIKDQYAKIADEVKKSKVQIKEAADKGIENVKTFFESHKDGLKKEIKAELAEAKKK